MNTLWRFGRGSNDAANDAWLGQTVGPDMPANRLALSFVRGTFDTYLLEFAAKKNARKPECHSRAGGNPVLQAEFPSREAG
jgi:hypothetical protein